MGTDSASSPWFCANRVARFALTPLAIPPDPVGDPDSARNPTPETDGRTESVFDSTRLVKQLAVMSTVPQSLVLTVADFRNLGEGPPHYQLIEGEIQRFEFSRDPAKPVQIIDEAEISVQLGCATGA